MAVIFAKQFECHQMFILLILEEKHSYTDLCGLNPPDYTQQLTWVWLSVCGTTLNCDVI